MVIYNVKIDGFVHIQDYFSAAGEVRKGVRVLCCPVDIWLNSTKLTRDNPTCPDCIKVLKYAVIIAKYSEFPTEKP